MTSNTSFRTLSPVTVSTRPPSCPTKIGGCTSSAPTSSSATPSPRHNAESPLPVTVNNRTVQPTAAIGRTRTFLPRTPYPLAQDNEPARELPNNVYSTSVVADRHGTPGRLRLACSAFCGRSANRMVVIGLTVVLAVTAGSSTPAHAGAKAEIREAHHEWVSALRRKDGETACFWMTRRAARIIRRAFDPTLIWDDCEEFIERQGGDVHFAVTGPIDEVHVRGRRGWAGRARSDGGFWFLRVDGDWLVHIPARSEWSKYPGGPTA